MDFFFRILDRRMFKENLQFSHSWRTKAPKQIENLPQTLC